MSPVLQVPLFCSAEQTCFASTIRRRRRGWERNGRWECSWETPAALGSDSLDDVVDVVFPQSGLLSSFSLSMTDLSKSCENLSTVMLYNPGWVSERTKTSAACDDPLSRCSASPLCIKRPWRLLHRPELLKVANLRLRSTNGTLNTSWSEVILKWSKDWIDMWLVMNIENPAEGWNYWFSHFSLRVFPLLDRFFLILENVVTRRIHCR